MREHQTNPPDNRIPPGIKEEALTRAITLSGFPLQGRVAHILSKEFDVLEEWGYVDEEKRQHRSLDIHATRKLGVSGEIAPAVSLLLECKRSSAPYIFFRTSGKIQTIGYPVITGLFNKDLKVEAADRSSRDARPEELFGMADVLISGEDPPICSAFTKAVPRGKRIELSGSDPYNRVILPLAKAQNFLQRSLALRQRQEHIFPTIVLPIAVIDAPLLLVESPDDAADPLLVPWVRVLRREAGNDPDARFKLRSYAIDVIHASYLQRHISEHVLPWVTEFARRAEKIQDILRHGALAPRLFGWKWDELKPRPCQY
jgi:hypothetical protein